MSSISDVSTFDQCVPAYLKRLERAMDHYLPAADTDPNSLHEAMRYACHGGKHLRALMVYAVGAALDIPVERLDSPACAIEFIHAYSLVHDDLPGMDNDDLRRGQPTVHKAYDEATAILVGDGLLTLAFEVLTKSPELHAEHKVQMISCLASAAGSRGMVGGQAVDMASENRTLTLHELESLHGRKTGALIRAACQLAGIAAGESEHTMRRLDRYGKSIGLAFQIQDDVLDQISDTATLGKTAGKDEAQHKSTFPSLLGLQEAQRRSVLAFDDARDAASELPGHAEPLLWLADHIQQRDH